MTEWELIEGCYTLWMPRGKSLDDGLTELASRVMTDLATMSDVASINLSVITAKELEGSDGCLTADLRDGADHPKAAPYYALFSPHIRTSHLLKKYGDADEFCLLFLFHLDDEQRGLLRARGIEVLFQDGQGDWRSTETGERRYKPSADLAPRPPAYPPER